MGAAMGGDADGGTRGNAAAERTGAVRLLRLAGQAVCVPFLAGVKSVHLHTDAARARCVCRPARRGDSRSHRSFGRGPGRSEARGGDLGARRGSAPRHASANPAVGQHADYPSAVNIRTREAVKVLAACDQRQACYRDPCLTGLSCQQFSRSWKGLPASCAECRDASTSSRRWAQSLRFFRL